MNTQSRHSTSLTALGGCIAAVFVAAQFFASESLVTPANSYEATVLVANRAEFKPTAFVDKYLINPWGIALRPPGAGGHFWVSNAGNASTSLYIGDVKGTPLHQDGLKLVTMDGPLVSYEDGLPNVTGQVYNAASDIAGQPVEFPVSGPARDLSGEQPVDLGVTSGAAKFVFVTTDGTINAWRAKTAESMNTAIIVKDFSERGADRRKDLRFLPAFTGVAMTTAAFQVDEQGRKVADNRLYVTDFQNGRVQVFDNQWRDISDRIPFPRPAGLAEDVHPYNIQCIGDELYVLYAVLNTDADDPGEDLPGKGHGHVVVHDRNGRILREVQDRDALNSPWGVAVAPEGFGAFGGKLLVANFGDGTIAAFDPQSGAFIDYLRDRNKEPLVLDGVWGLAFGNGVSLGDTHSLYYAAGPNQEQDGVFGRVTFAP